MKMKLNFWFLAIGVVALSACSSDNDLYDPAKAAAKKEAQYEAAFVKKYGTIAADQDWGFGAAAKTRAIIKDDQHPQIDDIKSPADITNDEKTKVTQWFTENKNPVSIDLDWTDFTIQNVSSSSYGSNMNQLYAGQEHVLDFNSGSGNSWRLVQDGKSSFSYHNSQDSQMHGNYTIQCIDGSYYVGFDFEANGQNSNQQTAADGYYNDWIVKISPANYTNASRIIAEDLGESDDFDFNDVVFDVATNGGATIVTLQAAGGTLPLYIQVGSDQREVHELFGVPTTTMVNTGGLSKAPVMYRVSGTGAVEIVVESQTAGTYKLKGDIGKAPQKIAVPTTYEWTEERQSIESKYPKFSDWVGDTKIDWIE